MALLLGSTAMFAAYGQQIPAEYDGAMKTLGACPRIVLS
jgi:hypothetical protein